MILYCIDKNHPLYGRRIRIDKAIRNENGTKYVDVESNVPIDLRQDQVSLYPPEDKENERDYI